MFNARPVENPSNSGETPTNALAIWICLVKTILITSRFSGGAINPTICSVQSSFQKLVLAQESAENKRMNCK